MKRTSLNFLIAFTGFGFTAIAVFLDLISPKIDLLEQLRQSQSAPLNLVFIGFMTAAIALWIHKLQSQVGWLKELDKLTKSLVSDLRPSFKQILMLSIAAGWGEEILFRGVLQQFFGICISSVIFAGIHTGFSLRSKALRSYFSAVFSISILLGVMTRYIGLTSSMVAHGTWDFTILVILTRYSGNSDSSSTTDRSQPDEDTSRRQQ